MATLALSVSKELSFSAIIDKAFPEVFIQNLELIFNCSVKRREGGAICIKGFSWIQGCFQTSEISQPFPQLFWMPTKQTGEETD